MEFKVGDKVEYCGNIGKIYRIQTDRNFEMICVEFPNIETDRYSGEARPKYLEFDLTGRLHSWTALPALVKQR